ncbi:MAG TPA: hypothetical protein VGA09_14630, partial [Candidatus Binatia bacterium]
GASWKMFLPAPFLNSARAAFLPTFCFQEAQMNAKELFPLHLCDLTPAGLTVSEPECRQVVFDFL